MSMSFRLGSAWSRQKAHGVIDGTPDGWIMTLREPRRSSEQSDKMWAMIDDLVSQKPEGRQHDKEDWKVLALALAGKRGKFLPSLDGDGKMEWVGPRSSTLTKQDMSDVIEALYAYGAEHGVKWSDQ